MGKAITFFTEDDKPMLRSVAHVMQESGCEGVPEWMLVLPKIGKRERRQLEQRPLERGWIGQRCADRPLQLPSIWRIPTAAVSGRRMAHLPP